MRVRVASPAAPIGVSISFLRIGLFHYIALPDRGSIISNDQSRRLFTKDEKQRRITGELLLFDMPEDDRRSKQGSS